MSVDYQAIVGVGEVFKHKEDAKNFIMSHTTLTEKQREALEQAWVEDYLQLRDDSMVIECLDLYSGKYFFLGYKVTSAKPEIFAQQVLKAAAAWNATFGQDGEMVREVCVS